MLIAIDPSTTKTGFAFGGPKDGSPRGGVWPLPGAAGDALTHSCGRLSDAIIQLAQLVKATEIVSEAPLTHMGEKASTEAIVSLLQLSGAVRAAAFRARCRLRIVPPSTVRKHFIGVGNLRRAEAKAAVQKRNDLFGWNYLDDNHADANAIWSWGMSTAYPTWSPQSTPLFARTGT